MTRSQGHTVVVLSDGSNAKQEQDTKMIKITGSSVNIRKGNGTQYAVIKTVKKGTTYEFVATASNDWNAVAVNGQVGWVSGNYSTLV